MMDSQEVVMETAEPAQKQKKEPESASRGLVLKAVLIKSGEYQLSNSIVLPSFDMCLLGEEGTVLVPGENVLPILGIGNENVKCSKCGYLLVMKINRHQLQNIAVKCPSCGHLNQL